MPKARKKVIENKCSKKWYKIQNRPKAVIEQCRIASFGKVFEHKCYVSWCQNTITVSDFHVGHDKPESKGGSLDLDNLKPLCARCNLSMGNNYTIKEWNKMMSPLKQKTSWWCCF